MFSHTKFELKNYRTGDEQRWRATGIRDTRSEAEIQKARQEAEQLRAEDTRKRAEKEERIAAWAQAKWERCSPVDRHPYLERKGVQGHGLRVDEKNRLLVRMRDLDGKLWSLQSISENGEKHYTAGGRKQGLHTLIGAYDPDKPLVFAEGFATAATVHEATGLAVAVTFDSGNLKPVAKAYRERHPFQSLIFAADNDHHLPLRASPGGLPLPDVGREKAGEAALGVNGSLLFPNSRPAIPARIGTIMRPSTEWKLSADGLTIGTRKERGNQWISRMSRMLCARTKTPPGSGSRNLKGLEP